MFYNKILSGRPEDTLMIVSEIKKIKKIQGVASRNLKFLLQDIVSILNVESRTDRK